MQIGPKCMSRSDFKFAPSYANIFVDTNEWRSFRGKGADYVGAWGIEPPLGNTTGKPPPRKFFLR